MADDNGGGVSVILLGALAIVAAFAFVGCDPTTIAPTASTGQLAAGDVVITDARQMATMTGQEVSAQGVRVQHVGADEGFWVDLVGGRAWVQMLTVGESPFTVHDGDIVSFRGRVVAHDAVYPTTIRMCSRAEEQALAAQTTHIEVPVGAMTFGVG